MMSLLAGSLDFPSIHQIRSGKSLVQWRSQKARRSINCKATFALSFCSVHQRHICTSDLDGPSEKAKDEATVV